jgi:hypothetical protein
MTAPGDIALADLVARRTRLAARADELAAEIDKHPAPSLRRRLDDVAAAIDAIDRKLATRKDKP